MISGTCAKEKYLKIDLYMENKGSLKKILWLVSWYPNRKDMTDGDFIQRQALAVALHLPVHVIYITKSASAVRGLFETSVKQEGNLTEQIVYYRAPGKGNGLLQKIISQIRYRRTYKKILTEWVAQHGVPRLVHVHVAAKAGMIALWMKQKWGTDYILTEHWTGYYPASIPGFNDLHAVVRRLTIKILKEAKLVLPVSKDLGEIIHNQYVRIKYEVVSNVVDTGHFFPDETRKQVFRFLHVSYLNYQKNPEGLIKAAALLWKKGLAFEMHFLGRADKQLEELVNSSGLPPGIITFKAGVPYAAVALEMQQASALVLFSRFENLPCVILEALCCGLPVISTRVGGIAEVIDESNGILVEVDEEEELAAAMQKMMEQYDRYDKMKIATRASATFNYNQIGKQLLRIYEQFIS